MATIDQIRSWTRGSWLLATSALLLAAAIPAQAQTFNDVPTSHFAYAFIETLAANNVTAGCGNGNYCPDDVVTRAQMAVFLERGMRGGLYSPPPATGNDFFDVASGAFAAAFIEQLFEDGITTGCGNGNYCPNAIVTRAQMAVFIVRAMRGSGFTPPAASGSVFADVGAGDFGAAFIEQLAADGITSGCGNNNYCPNNAVSRAQMGVFLVRAFQLTEPKPGFVVFRADKDVDGVEELYKFDPDSNESIKLSGPQVLNGDVRSSHSVSPDGQWVAYRADQDVNGQDELYVAAADGSGFNKINAPLPANGDVFEFSWSPDSSQIAYTADADQDNITEVFVADPDGSNHRKVSGGVGSPAVVELRSIQWSPDGRYLAQGVYTVGGSFRWEGINTYDADNPNPNSTRINPALASFARIEQYDWSPDSTQIAYVADADADGIDEVFMAGPDGQNHRKVNGAVGSGGDIEISGIAWSPNGRYLAQDVYNNNDGRIFGINTYDTQDGEANSTRIVTESTGSIQQVTWSTDSSRIAYMLRDASFFKHELYTVLTNGSGKVKVNGPLTENGSVINYAWSPDSSRIAYQADPEIQSVWELFTVRPDASELLKVNGPLVQGGYVYAFGWAPDNSRIAYTAIQDTESVFNLYTVRPNATGNVQVSTPPAPGGNSFVGTYHWSADASKIAYIAEQDTAAVQELYLSSPDGSSNEKISGELVFGGDVFDIEWSDR